MKTYWSIDVSDRINIFIEVINGTIYVNKMDRETLEIEEITEIVIDEEPIDYDNLIDLDDEEDLERFLKETD